MKVLQAPRATTVVRNTSVGEVSFVEGLATEFTEEQADYFCTKQKGYSVIEIPNGDETAPVEVKEEKTEKSESAPEKSSEGGIVDKLKAGAQAIASAVTVKDAETSTEDTPDSADHIQGNLHGLTSILVHLVNSSTGAIVAETRTDENGHWEFSDPGEGDFNVAFFGEGVEPEDAISGAEVGQTYPLEAVSESDNGTSEASGIFGNLRGLAGVSVALATTEGDFLRTTKTDENGNWVFDEVEDGTYHVLFDGEGASNNDSLSGTVENGVWSLSEDDSETVVPVEGDGSGITATNPDDTLKIDGEVNITAVPGGDGSSEEDSQDDELIDIGTADHDSLVKAAGFVGLDIEEGWSTEELRDALLAKGLSETSEEGSGDVQATSDGASSEGTGGTEAKSEVAEVKLPIISDGRRKIAKWCRDHNIADNGSKKELLTRIHEDPRYKK